MGKQARQGHQDEVSLTAKQAGIAFDLALSKKDWPSVQLLLKNRAFSRAKGKKALFEAVKEVQADKTAVDDFIVHFAPEMLRSSDQDGNTLLHHIAAIGNISLVERLINKAGLTITRKNNKGITVFMAAAEAHQWELIKKFTNLKTYGERQTEDSDAAIHYAILDNRFDMVDFLSKDVEAQVVAKEEKLDLGSARLDINTEHLIVAIKQNSPSLLSLLCRRVRFPKYSDDSHDPSNKTDYLPPIKVAAMLKHWGCVLVLAKHYKPTVQSGHGYALISAIEENQIEVVMALLERGSLHCLIKMEHVISIDALLEKAKLTGNPLLEQLLKGMINAKDEKASASVIEETRNAIKNTKVALIELLRSSGKSFQNKEEELNIGHLPVEVMDLIVQQVSNQSGVKNPPGVNFSDRTYLNLVKAFCTHLTKTSPFFGDKIEIGLFKKLKFSGGDRRIFIEKLQSILHSNLSVRNKIMELKIVIDDFVTNKGAVNGRTLLCLSNYKLIEAFSPVEQPLNVKLNN